MNKKWIVFVMLIVFSSFVSATWFSPDPPPPIILNISNIPLLSGNNNWTGNNIFLNVTILNQSILNINNTICLNEECIVHWSDLNLTMNFSQYVPYIGATSNVNLIGYSLLTSYLVGVVGGIDMRGDPWYFSGVNLTVAADILRLDSTYNNATMIIDSGGMDYSCIKLLEANNFGFTICNDGAGINRFVIANYEDGREWMWINRDDGTINFLNHTNVYSTINATGFCYFNGTCLDANYIFNVTNNGSYVPYTGADKDVNLNSQSLYAGHINATTGLFTEVNVSNNTLYVGNVKVSSSGENNLSINDGSGNLTAGFYYGSGQYLTDINLSNVNGTSVFGGNVTINGNLTLNGTIFGGYIEKYTTGNFIGSLYTSKANSSSSDSNSLFQVISDTRGTPQFLVQDGGPIQASFIARSFMVVNQNNTLLNSSQNNLCSNWGFHNIDCNTSSTGADLSVTDDIEALGLIYGSGLRSYSRVGKQRDLFIATENISTVFYGSDGEYNYTTNYFCDYIANNFIPINGWININDIDSDFEGSWANIGVVVNSSCVELINNPGWKTTFTNTTWRVINDPNVIFLRGGFGEYYIGDSPQSAFEFNTGNGTGIYSVVIDDTVGARSHKAFQIEQDMNGFSTIAQNIYMYSTKQLVDKDLIMLSMVGDATNMNSSDGVFIDMNIIGQPLTADGHIDGIKMPSGMSHLIEVGSSEVLDKVYYQSTDITTNVTTSGNLTNVFINNNDVIYIGNSQNFTKIGINLNTVSSSDITSLYYYCNNAGNWSPLSGVISTTGGFTSSGLISFTNPLDRGTCNKQLNGTLFTNTTQLIYIAIQRTKNNIVTTPILDRITISGASINMFLGEDILKLSHVDVAPEICNAVNYGAIYFDDSEDNLCVCKSSGWKVISDGSDCT